MIHKVCPSNYYANMLAFMDTCSIWQPTVEVQAPSLFIWINELMLNSGSECARQFYSTIRKFQELELKYRLKQKIAIVAESNGTLNHTVCL